MTDEKYSYIQDVKDKKNTARSARNKRTHNGKGGRVKFPSDYMTQKEIKAMSGEVKSYRLNEPMNWKGFKAMPDDIKVSYINLLRQKYNAPDRHICTMMGSNVCSFSQEMNRLGIPSTRKSSEKWDKEGFYAWCGMGVDFAKAVTTEIEKAEAIEVTPCVDQKEGLYPCSGTLCFVGTAEATLDAVKHILGNETVKITISWEAV